MIASKETQRLLVDESHRTSEAFERVWQTHRERIWRLVVRLAGSVDVADDLTQQIGLQALRGYKGFRRESQVLTWLYRIALNVVATHRQRTKIETVTLDHPALATLPASEQADPERNALRADQRLAVVAALDRLPEEMRTVLILQVYEGLKHREIAALLEIPMGTVASRIHHALQRLREELKDYGV